MIQDNVHFEKITTQTIEADWLCSNNVTLDILRLDKMHEIISGNKWFKLKYYFNEAIAENAAVIGTFGGAYSNHIVATAFACKEAGIKSIGIIRSEEPSVLSDTLQDAKDYGMQLYFVNRASYKDTGIIKEHFENVYWINEGGYGITGAKGATEILSFAKSDVEYTHIICAVGTGTMMAGIIMSAKINQEVIGVSVMKGNYELYEEVNDLLDENNMNKSFKTVHDYHFGGYAKHPSELIQFMNETWLHHHLATDIVYTAKTFYAAKQMIITNTIHSGSNVLLIHSGGLQGNRSLPENMLLF
jgi:1-aminocyclopropane-1-carboxylate deaminase